MKWICVISALFMFLYTIPVFDFHSSENADSSQFFEFAKAVETSLFQYASQTLEKGSGAAADSFVREVEFLSQRDPRWNNLDITGYGTIGNTGCLPSVAAMAINASRKTSYTPVDIGTCLHEEKQYGFRTDRYYSEGCVGSSWKTVQDKYGVEVFPLYTREEIYDFLYKKGTVAFCLTFSETSCHEVLLAGCDLEGNVLVYDPLDNASPGWYRLDDLMRFKAQDSYNLYEGSGIIGIQ